MSTIVRAAALCVLLAGCALPQQATTQAAAKATATGTHAAAPSTTPGPSFAAVVAVMENCAAGALAPGQRHRPAAFRICLGIQDVPASVVPCAERQFRLREGQGAEAVALGVKAECGKPSPTRESAR